MTPRVSIIMPAYNAERYVGEAIDSVLAQTYQDWELLASDDGSDLDDTTWDILCSADQADDRVFNMTDGDHRGVARALNKLLEEVRGEYIARMDADDIAYPKRLACQVAYMDAHPECVVCGTWARIIDADGKPTGAYSRYPITHARLHYTLCLGCCFVHSSVMMRREALEAVGGYPDVGQAEDTALWAKLVNVGKFHTLPEVLMGLRKWPGQLSVTHRVVQLLHGAEASAGVAEKVMSVSTYAFHVLSIRPGCEPYAGIWYLRQLATAFTRRYWRSSRDVAWIRRDVARRIWEVAKAGLLGWARWRASLWAAVVWPPFVAGVVKDWLMARRADRPET